MFENLSQPFEVLQGWASWPTSPPRIFAWPTSPTAIHLPNPHALLSGQKMGRCVSFLGADPVSIQCYFPEFPASDQYPELG
jgi:hypothetical protein